MPTRASYENEIDPYTLDASNQGFLGSGAPSYDGSGPAADANQGSPGASFESNPGGNPSGSDAGTAKYNTIEAPPLQPSAGPTSTPTIGALPGGTAAGPALPDFSSMLANIQNTADPSQQAVLRDQLARSLYTSLGSAGHDVKWQGDQLMVDGRPYVVGGNTGVAGAAGQVDASRAANAGTLGQYGLPAGADATKFNDASYHSPKYDLLRDVSMFPPTPQGLQQAVARANAEGGHYQIQGDDSVIDTETGDHIDLIQDVNGPNAKWWYGSELEYANAHPGEGMPPPSYQIDSGSQNVQIPTSVTSAPGLPPGAAGWQPGQGPSYTPGDIPLDTPEFSFDELYNRIMQGDETEGATQQLLDRILANPESLDQHTTDTLKARSKDTIAEQQQVDEDNLRGAGVNMGIDDSNWLASERLASRRDRDRQLNDASQNIDIQAATTNAADRRAAATLGLQYSGQKTSERQAATALAADTTLRAAAAKGDRLALREAVAQKATELGISQDQVMSQWLTGLMDDATRNRSITSNERLTLQQLSQTSREFQEELAYKLAALAQANEEFGASYGLDFIKTEHEIDEDNWKRSNGG